MYIPQTYQRGRFWGISSLREVGGFAHVMAIPSLVIIDDDPFPSGFSLEREDGQMQYLEVETCEIVQRVLGLAADGK